MRFSVWSSDLCSSDLAYRLVAGASAFGRKLPIPLLYFVIPANPRTPMSSISDDVRPYAKEILLALCFLSALPAIVNRSADIVGAFPHAGYLVLFIIFWGGLLVAAYTSQDYPRWTIAFILVGQAYYIFYFYRVSND